MLAAPPVLLSATIAPGDRYALSVGLAAEDRALIRILLACEDG
jgi:hypothetical protein